MQKPVKVVLLSTNSESKILKVLTDDMAWRERPKGNIEFHDSPWKTNKQFEALHMYIVDEEAKIKEGNWVYEECKVGQADIKGIHHCESVDFVDGWIHFTNENLKTGLGWCKKIIASTDPSLGLPSISQSFLEQFVAVQGKGDVMMEMVGQTHYCNCGKSAYGYECDGNLSCTQQPKPKLNENGCVVLSIKPTNETLGIQINQDVTIVPNRMYDDKTAQTIEEAANQIWVSKEFQNCEFGKSDFIKIFKAGAEWKAEQSANDVIEFFEWVKQEYREFDTIMENNKPVTSYVHKSKGGVPSRIKKLYELWQNSKKK